MISETALPPVLMLRLLVELSIVTLAKDDDDFESGLSSLRSTSSGSDFSFLLAAAAESPPLTKIAAVISEGGGPSNSGAEIGF